VASSFSSSVACPVLPVVLRPIFGTRNSLSFLAPVRGKCSGAPPGGRPVRWQGQHQRTATPAITVNALTELRNTTKFLTLKRNIISLHEMISPRHSPPSMCRGLFCLTNPQTFSILNVVDFPPPLLGRSTVASAPSGAGASCLQRYRNHSHKKTGLPTTLATQSSPPSIYR
jgi:hypothetical protein